MKTEITNTQLVDILIVCRDLPQDEIDQIEAFSGSRFDPQYMAVDIMSGAGPRWTCKIAETGEPIVVAGFDQIGANIWRSFMLATNQAWEKYGGEVTKHARDTVDQLVRGRQHIRLETICLEEREKARAWYPQIGLEYEATLAGYGTKGQSAVLYTKIQSANTILSIEGARIN